MKTFVLAAVIASTATVGLAGNLEEPVIEAPVIAAETRSASSAAGVWIPLVLLAIVAAVVSAD